MEIAAGFLGLRTIVTARETAQRCPQRKMALILSMKVPRGVREGFLS